MRPILSTDGTSQASLTCDPVARPKGIRNPTLLIDIPACAEAVRSCSVQFNAPRTEHGYVGLQVMFLSHA